MQKRVYPYRKPNYFQVWEIFAKETKETTSKMIATNKSAEAMLKLSIYYILQKFIAAQLNFIGYMKTFLTMK